MGIPSFYRWLMERYPAMQVSVVEERARRVNGVELPIDTSRPNPNGFEFDNLYLDMNGIIHPCFHPTDMPPPKTYKEVFNNVFKYIDRIFSIVRPRKVLFLGIDGVAPRAKMNQQRSRRFRAAKEAEEERKRSRQSVGNKLMDSNVITPGTEFMDLLSSALRYYIRLRMNNDVGWRGIKVILSDSNVPGEGEHKIMSYIRLQRDLPEYDPNTRHCLYGLDADLIMLALATHEVYFTILREEMFNGKAVFRGLYLGKRRKDKSRKLQIRYAKSNHPKNLEEYVTRLQFKFVNIWVLREQLKRDMRIPELIVQTDLDRLIDDFIFMCLFVGNDFLPHLPTLQISEGAIDLLMWVYRKEFRQMGGYLTSSFEIDFTRFEHFIQAVGLHDDAIFRARIKKLEEKSARRVERSSQRKLFVMQRRNRKNPSASSIIDGPSLTMEKTVDKNIKEPIAHSSDVMNTTAMKVHVGAGDWKENYYAEKFNAKTKDVQESIRRDVVFKYVEGICWVMRYYYEGVCSWQWFYPYHYAPFASDFHGLDQLKVQFTLGEPFKPLDQLMGVLPAASAHALPVSYRKLMTSALSPIRDFYPLDFEVDKNGKRRKWQAICKLPFIDETRLLSEIAKVEHTLTDDERRRNSLGSNTLYVHISHPVANTIIHFSKQGCDPDMVQQIDPKLSGGMNGFVCATDKDFWSEEVYPPIGGMPMIAQNSVISVSYRYPLFHYHISKLPQGVILPDQGTSPRFFWNGASRRQTQKSPSLLVTLALQLESLRNRAKQKDSQEQKGPDFYNNEYKMENIETEGNSRKRKWSSSKKSTTDDGCDASQSKEGEQVPLNLKQCIPHEHVDGDCITGAMKEIKTEIIPVNRERRKERKRLNKIKEKESSGVEDKNVVQLEHSIHENNRQADGNAIKNFGGSTSIERLEGFVVSEKRQSDDAHAGVTFPVKREGQQVPPNLKQCISEEQTDGNCKKERKRLKKKKDRESLRVLEKNVVQVEPCIETDYSQAEVEGQESCITREERKGDDAPKSKKRKVKSDKSKQKENDDSPASEEQGKAAGISETTAATSNNVEELERSCHEQRGGDGLEILGSCIIGKERKGDDARVGTLECLPIMEQVKSKKRKHKSGKAKQNKNDDSPASRDQEGKGVGISETTAAPSKNVEKLERSCHVQLIGGNDLGRLESCTIGEERKGDDAHVGAQESLQIKGQVKSKKSKRKSGKGKQNENDDIPASIEQGGKAAGILEITAASSNSIEKLERSCHVPQIGGNDLERLESCIMGEESKSVDAHVGTLESLPITGQVKSKKRKHKSGEGKQNKNDDSPASREQGISETTAAPSNDVEKLDRSCPVQPIGGNDLGRLESCTMGEERKGDDAHVGAQESLQIKGQVKSKKSKRKSGKGKQNENDDIPTSSEQERKAAGILDITAAPSNNVEKLERSCHVQQIGCNNLERQESCIIGEERKGDDVQESLQIKGQVKSKKKRKSGKSKQKENDDGPASREQEGKAAGISETIAAPSNNFEKLERACQVLQIGGNDLETLESCGQSNQVKHRCNSNLMVQSQGKRLQAFDGVPVDNNRKHVGGDGDYVGQVAVVDMKTDVKSRKKKRRSKGVSVLDNSTEKLESNGQIKQANHDGDGLGAKGLMAEPHGKTQKEFDCVQKSLEEAGNNATGKEVGCDDHVGSVAAAETNTEGKPRKKKKQKKNGIESDGQSKQVEHDVTV